MDLPKAISILTDSCDSNASVRQEVRSSVLFPTIPVYLKEVLSYLESEYSTVSGAGMMIDVLDAAMGESMVIMGNVAPRGKEARRWQNGTPFGYLFMGKALVVTTVDGYMLSMIKKFGLADSFYVMDIKEVSTILYEASLLDDYYKEYVAKTQFRSYEFMPRVARYIWEHGEIKSEKEEIASVPDIGLRVWKIDNFGNIKTTALPEDIGFEEGLSVKTKYGEFKCYGHLKDVPDGEVGIIIGSSGYMDKRLIEIVKQRDHAGNVLGALVGDEVL